MARVILNTFLNSWSFLAIARFVAISLLPLFLSGCGKEIEDFVKESLLISSTGQLQAEVPTTTTTTTSTTSTSTTTTTLPSGSGTYTLIKDIRATGTAMTISNMVVGSGHLYFVADDGVAGSEIWATDGTSANTNLVSEYNLGATGTTFESFAVIGDNLITSLISSSPARAVYSYDANTSSKTLLFDQGDWAGKLMAVGGSKVVFQGYHPATGQEPWVTNGTPGGTQLISDTRSGTSLFDWGYVDFHYNSVLDKVFFVNERGSFELWASDYSPSSPSGTLELGFAVVSWVDGKMVSIGGTTYFKGADASDYYGLYKTDGTTPGTSLVKNPNSTTTLAYFSIVGIVNSKVIFIAEDGVTGRELWVSDGTPSGTTLLKDIVAGASYPSFGATFFTAGSLMYFSANDGVNGEELWVTDGTLAGTQMLKDINPGGSSSSPKNFVTLAGKVYFVAEDGTNGREIWETDGTLAGTAMMAELNPGAGSSALDNLIVFNSKIFLSGTDATGDFKLYSFTP